MSTSRNTTRAWNYVSNLPVEQSLVLGGGGTLAFFEILSYAQGFLQTNTKKIFDLLWPVPTSHVHTVADILKKGNLGNNTPLIAREGVVGSMLLTQSGIFYLRGENLILYGAAAYVENGETESLAQAISELSPHAFSLYQMAANKKFSRELAQDKVQKTLKFHFDELLDDCLLHMILNDFQLILSKLSSESSQNTTTVAELVLDLIKRITLTKDSKPTPTYVQKMYEYIWTPAVNINEAGNQSSKVCLTQWVDDNKEKLKSHLKHQLQTSLDDPQIFYKQYKAPSVESLHKTACDWHKSIGDTLTISLHLLPDTALDGTWTQVGKLQYSIM